VERSTDRKVRRLAEFEGYFGPQKAILVVARLE